MENGNVGNSSAKKKWNTKSNSYIISVEFTENCFPLYESAWKHIGVIDDECRFSCWHTDVSACHVTMAEKCCHGDQI